jgi:hypothetical protein
MKRIIFSVAVMVGLLGPACSDAEPGTPGVAQDVGLSADAGVSPEDAGDWVPDIVDPGNSDATSAPEKAPLQVFTISPDRGLASGLEQVEIMGEGFEAGVQVFFGESMAQDTFVLDNNRIAALTPPRVPGLVNVRLVNPDTSETAVLESGYLFYNPVSIIEVDPANGHVLGGDAITIKGSGFVPGSVVLIGGKSAISAEIMDDNTILAVTPEATEAGLADVHVSNTIGVGGLLDGFLYYASPTITSVVPPVGLVDGGNVVEVKGAGFNEPLAVTFGGKALENITVHDEARLSGTVPEGDSVGAVDVVLSTSYGAAAAKDAYTYLGAMEPGDVVELLAVTPPNGPASGGNHVTVVATGLTTEEDTSLTIGGENATVKFFDPNGLFFTVEVPAGEIGSTDVVLTNGKGTHALEDGYTYDAYIKVYEALPNFGPTAGGTPITVHGTGFVQGAQVRVGALPASNVQVVDGETITAVTPPGSPGLANVTVLQGALSDSLLGGFAYTSSLELWVVDPPQGSQAGGTSVQLIGSGFPNDAKVSFGGSSATHVQVLSPTLIRCKTPPGEIGTVDVEIQSVTKGDVFLPMAFTYYNPESSYGGTWGNAVDGVLNVTVLSGGDGSPIADAFVMLWTDPDTPYQGFTNVQGQITFSGADLEGEQMVTASKEGFASTSVIDYDATNVTLYMTPTSPPSPGGPPPGVTPPVFKGQVVNLTKYVPVPWGKCSQKLNAPGTLCDPCQTDADCGGLSCSPLPGQGTYCTSHCVDNTDCAEGFMCYPINGMPEPQCVPSAGTVSAFCNFTKTHWGAAEGPGYRNYMAQPGLEVQEDFSFEFTLPLGESAVYCWGGIVDLDTQAFTPYALGLKRHVMAMPGDIFEEDVVLNHALSTEATIRLDDPPSNPLGPDFNYLFVHIDLGSDGTLEFLEHPFSFGDGELVMNKMPKALTGDLYDASYTMLGGAFSMTDNNLPNSLTLHYGIRDTEDDTMYVYDATGWKPRPTGIITNIYALTSDHAGSVIGVGGDGLIARAMGENFAQAWASQPSGVDKPLKAVHATAEGKAVAVGENGVATHFNGVVWEAKSTGTANALEGVHMFAEDDVFAVGWYQVRHFDGTSWKPMQGNTSKNLRGVWGATNEDVWAVGNYGQIIRYDGNFWKTQIAGTVQNLRAVWGSGPDDVFIVGEGGTILHWDGLELLPMAVDTLGTFEDVWGAGPNDVYAVGAKGLLFRYDGTQWLDDSPVEYDSTFLCVAGAEGGVVTSGTHELILGPMLEVPENIKPTDGGLMGDDYTLSWTVQPGVDPHFSYVAVLVPGMFGPVPEWTMVNDWNVTDILLPDNPSIEGTPGIAPGLKILQILRVYKEGFDINNYSNMDLNQSRWNSWAVDVTTFNKQ